LFIIEQLAHITLTTFGEQQAKVLISFKPKKSDIKLPSTTDIINYILYHSSTQLFSFSSLAYNRGSGIDRSSIERCLTNKRDKKQETFAEYKPKSGVVNKYAKTILFSMFFSERKNDKCMMPYCF
jgi:hypothetical protein